jgi:hypothetical protein
MELVIRAEPGIDFIETARLANEAFGNAGTLGFTPQRLAWLYERGFSGATDVLSLFSGERKVGQVALVRQVVIRFLLAVPNGKAAGVNQRFLGLRRFLKLDIRVGLASPLAGPVVASAPVREMAQREAQALFARYAPGVGDGLDWTAASLWQRLQDPSATYGVHATANVLLVSSRRVLRHVPHTLFCAFVTHGREAVSVGDVRAVTAAACRMHRRPLFVYAGLNAAVPLPGWALPESLRPSPMVVQIRDFSEPEQAVGFDRFELLDFDFA